MLQPKDNLFLRVTTFGRIFAPIVAYVFFPKRTVLIYSLAISNIFALVMTVIISLDRSVPLLSGLALALMGQLFLCNHVAEEQHDLHELMCSIDTFQPQ